MYLNAAIEDNYAYNSMPDRHTKLQTFDRFLHSIQEKLRPDLLFIACNTLSALFHDTYFDHQRHIPVQGIVHSGVRIMLAAYENEKDTHFIVFATPTTVEEAIYSKLLQEHGVPANQVVEQACPGLPDAISNDSSGYLAIELLKKFVPAALARMENPSGHVAAFLGCTHYGYQSAEFENVLQRLVPGARVLNPNHVATDSILSLLNTKPGEGCLKVGFYTRSRIPKVVMDSLSDYIGDRAPATLSALRNYSYSPELCGEL